MYTVIPEFNEFDRGIDFMRNSFQFFFIPFLSMVLYGLIVGGNKLINHCCQRDIPLISQYLQPRWPLHIAAYTLVQALPVTFFFFAQLNDLRFSSPNEPNASYPVFNIAMAFIALFLTCAIPLLLVVMIYSRYNSHERRVSDALGFKELFLNLLESKPTRLNKARMDDPLWTCSPFQIVSYGFCLAVFYLTILWGFFTSFFYDRFAWQITGLIVATAAFMAFAAVNDQFDSGLMKAFWIIFSLLLIAFLLLLAAIGSTITAAPCDLENLGYLGIGFLFALLLAALIASLYLLYLTLDSLYQTYFKSKRLIVPVGDIDESEVEEKPERTKAFHSNTSRMKSTYMKNPIQSSAHLIGSRMNIASSTHNGLHTNGAAAGIGTAGALAIVGGDRIRVEDEAYTGDRMIIHEVKEEDETANMRDRLVFVEIDPRTGEYVFRTERSGQEYRFDAGIGGQLRDKQPIYIDHNEEIKDYNNLYLGNLRSLQSGGQRSSLIVGEETNGLIPSKPANNTNIIVINEGPPLPAIRQTVSDELDLEPESHRRMLHNMGQPEVEVNNVVHNVFVIEGEEYTKEGEDGQGNFVLRNNRTREVRVLPGSQFQRTGGFTVESIQELPRNNEPVRIDLTNGGGVSREINSTGGISIQQSPEVAEDIRVNKVSFPKNRTFRHNGVDYMDMGEDNGVFKLFNKTERSMKRVPLSEYLRMNSEGFANRVNINGVEYDVEGSGPNGTILLYDNYTRQPRTISAAEFETVKRQNQEAFDRMMGRPNVQYEVVDSSRRNQSPVYEASSGGLNAANLLLQSKAGREEPTAMRGNNSKKTITEIEVVQSNYPQQAQSQEIEDEDEETIEKVLERSPGPFQLYVVPGDRVTEIDEEDHYEKEDAVETLTMEGRNVMRYMEIAEQKHPNAVIFMVDLHSQEEYRLN